MFCLTNFNKRIVFKVGFNLCTYAGMTELGWQEPLPREEGARAFAKGGGGKGDRRSSLDFEQAFFLISSCLYYRPIFELRA